MRGWGEGGRLIRIYGALGAGSGKFNRDTTNILGPSPTSQTVSKGQSFICTLKTQNVYKGYSVNDTRRKGINVFIR